jgi:hypothetical protein
VRLFTIFDSLTGRLDDAAVYGNSRKPLVAKGGVARECLKGSNKDRKMGAEDAVK